MNGLLPHDSRKSHNRGIKIHWEQNQDNDWIFLSDQIYNPILNQQKCFSVTEDKIEGGEKSKNKRVYLGNLMTCRMNYMYFHSYSCSTYIHLGLMVSPEGIISVSLSIKSRKVWIELLSVMQGYEYYWKTSQQHSFYLAWCVNVKERFMSDAEGLLGFVNLSRLHLFHSGSNDFFFYAQQTDIEIALANRLSLKNTQKHKLNHLYSHHQEPWKPVN